MLNTDTGRNLCVAGKTSEEQQVFVVFVSVLANVIFFGPGSGQVYDVKECRGQLAVECGDDPTGGFSTLSAHRMAHGGVIPHSSSSELSAHQMPALLTSARLQRPHLLFGAKSGKGRVRSHMMWLPHHPRLGKGVERGHMMCLSHLPRICPGKELSEDA